MTESIENLHAPFQRLVDNNKSMIPGLIIQRNYYRQFADRVVAEAVPMIQHIHVDLYNYPSTFSFKQMKSNWETLCRKILSKLGISMDKKKKQIDEAAKGEANTIDEILIMDSTLSEQQNIFETGETSKRSIGSGHLSARPSPGEDFPNKSCRLPPISSRSKIEMQSQLKPANSITKRRSIDMVTTQYKMNSQNTTVIENVRAPRSTEYIFSSTLFINNPRAANDQTESLYGIYPFANILGNLSPFESKSLTINSLELIHKQSKISEGQGTSICEADIESPILLLLYKL